jgi:hypothetical protein
MGKLFCCGRDFKKKNAQIDSMPRSRSTATSSLPKSIPVHPTDSVSTTAEIQGNELPSIPEESDQDILEEKSNRF